MSSGIEHLIPEATSAADLRAPVLWGVVVGVLQAFSPLGFWWLDQDVVWAISIVVIASVYIGFAVADGRTLRIATEVAVTSGFVILALASIEASPWLLVVALLAHGAKDLWQHRTRFVANTRWWPPFCLVVDVVAAAVIAALLLAGTDLS